MLRHAWGGGAVTPLFIAVAWLCLASCGSHADEVADLRAQLQAERARVKYLEKRLSEAEGKLEGNALPAARRIPAGLGTCPTHSPPNGSEALPAGSFNKSCSSCFRFGDSLRCSCFRKDDVDPTAGLLVPRGNLTGLWSIQTNSELSAVTTNALGIPKPGSPYSCEPVPLLILACAVIVIRLG